MYNVVKRYTCLFRPHEDSTFEKRFNIFLNARGKEVFLETASGCFLLQCAPVFYLGIKLGRARAKIKVTTRNPQFYQQLYFHIGMASFTVINRLNPSTF